MLCDDLEGVGWGTEGGRHKREGLHVCFFLIHVAVESARSVHIPNTTLWSKRNALESVLMRRMSLRPIIQHEVRKRKINIAY